MNSKLRFSCLSVIIFLGTFNIDESFDKNPESLIQSLIFASGLAANPLHDQIPAYRLYDSRGNRADFRQVMDSILMSDVVLYGELHNNPISHWLRFEIIRRLHGELEGRSLILGSEIFESDTQVILDEYLKGYINERNFRSSARLWPNFDTDYKPLFEWAKENSVPFVATNIPRRYASIIFHRGIEGLEELPEFSTYRRWMMPFPFTVIDSVIYDHIRNNMPGSHGTENGNSNLITAQAARDATMARFILASQRYGSLMFHFHGRFHSDYYGGIYDYLRKYNRASPERRELRIITFTTVQSDNPDQFIEDYRSLADFIIVVSSTMTETH